MQHRQLGNSGFKIPVIGLGGTVFGKHFYSEHYLSEKDTALIIDRAADLGINFIDTANIYSRGDSEIFISKTIRGRRDHFIIASKAGLPAGEGPNEKGLSRGHIMDSIEGTLRRLGTDYVDLYYAHWPDPSTPTEETVRAFDDLVRQGKARYVGCSNFSGWEIAAAREISECWGYAPFVVSQSPYNLLERSVEAEVAPCCLHYGMSVVVYFALAQGVLTGKYRPGVPIPPNTRAWKNPSPSLAEYMSAENQTIVERLDAWAKDQGRRVGELAIAWLLTKAFVCSLVIGVTSIEQLEVDVKATTWQLTPEQVREVEEIVDKSDGS